MPIITPAYPQQNSTFNVTFSTREVMLHEFHRGNDICTEIVLGRKTWLDLFEPIQFFALFKWAESTCRREVWGLWHSFCDRCWNVDMTNKISVGVMMNNLNLPGIKIKVWFNINLYLSRVGIKAPSANTGYHTTSLYMYTVCAHFLCVTKTPLESPDPPFSVLVIPVLQKGVLSTWWWHDVTSVVTFTCTFLS